MNFDNFINKLEDAEKFSRIENAYSHIVSNIFDIVLDNSFCLLDVSSWERVKGNQILLPMSINAVPDFLITKKNEFLDENNCRLGCIEVKFKDRDVEDESRLFGTRENNLGYLSVYNYVIYTNGWKWICYRNTREKNKRVWECNFRIHQDNKEYGRLLYNLCTIDWDNKPEINNDVI